jgi:hypothetical protein
VHGPLNSTIESDDCTVMNAGPVFVVDGIPMSLPSLCSRLAMQNWKSAPLEAPLVRYFPGAIWSAPVPTS